MVYSHPEIIKDKSGRICAQALSTLAPAAEEIARAVAKGRSLRPLELGCPVEGCRAKFSLRAVRPDKMLEAPPREREGPEAQAVEKPAEEPRETPTEKLRPVGAARPEVAGPGTGRPKEAAKAPPASEAVKQKPKAATSEPEVAPQPARQETPIARNVTAQVRSLVASTTGRAVPFLARLDPALVREMVSSSELREYAAPTTVITEGQEGEALYVVARGQVEVVKVSEDGGRGVVLASLGKGDCFGEMSLLTGQPATATVRTKGDGTAVLALPRGTLEDLLARRRTLYREFSRIIAERLYSVNARLEEHASRGMTGRLSMVGIADLIQTMHASRRTGTLVVTGEGGARAMVGFRAGEVTGALVGEKAGAEGFYDLLAWREGEFTFEGGEPYVEATPEAAITEGTMGLLMEGMRRLDEKGVHV
jgi:CRP-like cAMP-binding protein